jgi:hypothetical protein
MKEEEGGSICCNLLQFLKVHYVRSKHTNDDALSKIQGGCVDEDENF